MERAALLFGCYRRGDANDPETYVAAVAAVLSLYGSDIIREATDPRTGIQTSEKFAAFMPNAGELKIYCEAIAARKERMRQLAAIPKPVPADRRLEAPAQPQGSWANVFVPEGHARYQRMVDATEKLDRKFWKFGHSSEGVVGLWIALNVWQDGGAQQVANKFDWANIKPTTRDLSGTPELRAAMAQRLDPEPTSEEMF